MIYALALSIVANVVLLLVLGKEIHGRILAEWDARIKAGIIEEIRSSTHDMRTEVHKARMDLKRAEKELAEAAIVSAGMLDSARQQERRRFDAIESRLLGQIQAMAERLATLKIKWNGEGDPTEGWTVEEDAVVGADLTLTEQPYAPALSDFISALESEDAKEMVETYIESRREEGKIDEQILEMLERGEY